jgi:hypothetical protein
MDVIVVWMLWVFATVGDATPLMQPFYTEQVCRAAVLVHEDATGMTEEWKAMKIRAKCVKTFLVPTIVDSGEAS